MSDRNSLRRDLWQKVGENAALMRRLDQDWNIVTAQTAFEIVTRFADEQVNIERYIRMTLRMARIDNSVIHQVNLTLSQEGIATLPKRLGPAWQRFSEDDLRQLVQQIAQILPAIDARIDQLDGEFPNRDFEPRVPIEYSSCFYEWKDFFEENIPEDANISEIDHVANAAVVRKRHEQADPMLEDDADFAIEHSVACIAATDVFYGRIDRKISTLRSIREECETINFFARMHSPEAEVNILRQGFILLMTAFDAAVFDLTRVALDRNFFGLIAKFDRDSKIATSSIAATGSFDALKSKLVGDALRAKQLRGLLFELKDLAEPLLNPKGKWAFAHLIELVLRRNLHIHKRGIVDDGYLDSDPGKKPKFNIDGLKLGEVASIDRPYLDRANEICQDCISAIGRWADLGT